MICNNANCRNPSTREVKNVDVQSVQTAYKLLRATKPILSINSSTALPIEILVNSRLKPSRCVDCTYANCTLTESWGCGEVKNVVLQSVQAAYKLLRATKPIVSINRWKAPPMEIVNSPLKTPRCDDCTNENCKLTDSWGCGEDKNVLQSVQKAYKLLQATKPILPIHRGIVPPIEIFVKSRLKPARFYDCTNANCILTESWGSGEVKNVVLQSVQAAYKRLRATKPIVSIIRGKAPPMEIVVNSRLKTPRCDDCTNENWKLTDSWGCGEDKNVILQSVQKAYKLLRATKPILSIHRGIAPPIEIFVKSRLKPARSNDCTNASCILTESWGSGEIKNVVFQSVQTAYKLLRATRPILSMNPGIAPPMKILVNLLLMLAKCDDCTNANSILTESWGSGEVKNVFLQSVQTAYKLLLATKPILHIHRGVAPLNGNSR